MPRADEAASWSCFFLKSCGIDAPTPDAPAMPGQACAANGGGRQRNLTSRLRFCAVAVSRTSSLAPLKPRSRSRSTHHEPLPPMPVSIHEIIVREVVSMGVLEQNQVDS